MRSRLALALQTIVASIAAPESMGQSKQKRRKQIASGENYLRSVSVSKENLKPVREKMEQDFQSGLVKDLKNSNSCQVRTSRKADV